MYLGIDIGTSGVKCVLVSGGHKVVDSHTEPLTVSRPHPGWSEQNPDAWWEATLEAVDRVLAAHDGVGASIKGIGLSGQQHGATLLGEDDEPLRPCILWNDTRSAAEAEMLEAEADFRGITGNIVMPGFTAPKLAWVRSHEPPVFDRTRTVLLPKDFIRLKLTGEKLSDMSDSSGTSWMDVARRDWSDALLAATHLDRSHMPGLVEGSVEAGRLRHELAHRWGIPDGVPVAGGGGDNAASACGIGAVTPGAAFLSLGTSGVLFVSTNGFAPNPDSAVHAFCHALPATWHQMGVILSAVDSLNWLGKVTGRTPAELTALAEDSGADPSGVTFLPYLGGERTPHNDARARGVFLGLSHATDAGVLAKAVMEGVAFAFRDCLDALAAAGTRVDRVIAVGGGSRSPAWLKILASVLGVPVDLPADGDFGGAFGAARLAMAAANGLDPSLFAPPAIVATLDPEADLVRRYREGHDRYRRLYKATRELLD